MGRRREIRRQQGTRRLRIVVALTAVSLLAVLCIAILNSELADVDAVSVVGNSRTSSEAVEAASGIVLGHPMLDLDLTAAERQVVALPWVETVDIDRRLDGQVVLRVVEREPVAALPAGGGYVLVDRSGLQLETVAARPDDFIPVVGITASGRPGEYAPQETTLVLNMINAVTPTLRPEVVALMIEAEDLVVELRNGGQAIFGDSSQLGEKIQALETLLARVDLRCVSTIDVRVPSAAAVKRSESAEGACI